MLRAVRGKGSRKRRFCMFSQAFSTRWLTTVTPRESVTGPELGDLSVSGGDTETASRGMSRRRPAVLFHIAPNARFAGRGRSSL